MRNVTHATPLSSAGLAGIGVSAVLLAASALAQPEYSFVLVDSFNADPRRGEGYVWDINDNGVACGMATMDNVIGYPGFVWNAVTGKTRIPITNPHGINNFGLVVGTGGVHDTQADTTIVPPNLPGTYYGPALYGVNDLGVAVGSIAGCSCSDSGGVLRIPYVWDAVGGARTIDMWGAKGLLRVNNSNLAIGWLNGWSSSDGFVYDLNTGWAVRLSDVFPPEIGSPPTRANDISDLGVVVGTRAGSDSSVRYGYTYSADRGVEILPFLGAGYQQALSALGINREGVVVGESNTVRASRRAFVFIPGRGSRDLNSAGLVESKPAGYTLISAEKVNDAGQIAGYGTTAAGKITGYVLNPRRIACPADFNGDTFVDFFDYAAYLACFESGVCPEGRQADFNGDGFVDFFDYGDFVAAFSAGC